MALIGYARVSTQDQNLALQKLALDEAGCKYVFEDDGHSAVNLKRPGFLAALEAMSSGDVFVIWKMDRAFRSLRHALDVQDQFERRGIELRCLTEPIDTTTPIGKCFYQVRNSFAELERSFISERTIAGMRIARANGAKIGRPRKLSAQQILYAKNRMTNEPPVTVLYIAEQLGVAPSTLIRSIKRHQQEGTAIIVG